MRRFRPGWRMTLFVTVMLPTVIALGCWQLDRADLKRGYEARYFERMALPAIAPPPVLVDMDFQRVRIHGAFAPEEYFLVDNQTHDGRVGYWVVGILAADDGRRWLVNRGWVAAPSRRDDWPAVNVPAAKVWVEGIVWPDTGKVPLLSDEPQQESDVWPRRIPRLDPVAMADAAEVDLPMEIRLEPQSEGVLGPASTGHDFKTRTHEGYAAQWFGLGIVLVGGYLFFGWRKHD